jgi:hypothetical protein
MDTEIALGCLTRCSTAWTVMGLPSHCISSVPKGWNEELEPTTRSSSRRLRRPHPVQLPMSMRPATFCWGWHAGWLPHLPFCSPLYKHEQNRHFARKCPVRKRKVSRVHYGWPDLSITSYLRAARNGPRLPARFSKFVGLATRTDATERINEDARGAFFTRRAGHTALLEECGARPDLHIPRLASPRGSTPRRCL